MEWLRFLGGGRRRRSPWNNVGKDGALTCGRLGSSLLLGGEIGPRDWAALSNAGVSVVVNLQEEQQDVFSPGEKLDGYLWLPAPDQRAPSVEQIIQGVAFMRGAISNNRKVFVHCKAGQGRAPLLCACYLISEGATIMDAIKRVQTARPSTNLTPEQSARLREFTSHLATNNARASQDKPTARLTEAAPPDASTHAPNAPGAPNGTPNGTSSASPVTIPAVAPVAAPAVAPAAKP